MGQPGQVLETVEGYRKLGVNYIIVIMRDLVKLKFASLEEFANLESHWA